MKNINLKDFYPFYQEDCFIDLSPEIAELLQRDKAREATYQRKLRYHEAYFSLDRNDGIEKRIVFKSYSPEEIYERKITCEQLYAAMETLTDKQAKRLYAHFFLGLSKSEIARNEGVDCCHIVRSINLALKKIGRYLKSIDC